MAVSFDPTADLVAFTHRVHHFLTNDIKAISAEKLNVSPGGSARAPLHIVAECAAINGMVAAYLMTGETKRLPPDEREEWMSSFTTREATLQVLNESTAALVDAIQGLDPSTFGEISDQPFGRSLTRFAIAQAPAAHMMYHDGQLNYLQTLYGDTEVHWG